MGVGEGAGEGAEECPKGVVLPLPAFTTAAAVAAVSNAAPPATLASALLCPLLDPSAVLSSVGVLLLSPVGTGEGE